MNSPIMYMYMKYDFIIGRIFFISWSIVVSITLIKNQLCVHVDGASLAVMSIDLGSEFMKMGLVKVRL